MATYRTDITRNIEPAMANPGTLAKAAEAKAGAVKTLAGLAGEAYKGYTEYKIAGYEREASELATEYFVKGQAVGVPDEPALEQAVAARNTMFAKRDTAAASEFSPESQTAIQKQLSILDSEVTRLTNAVNGGMSNVQYQERINTLMRKAIAQMPGKADDIRERVGALTGLPGAERWATMQYVRDRFTPPKESKVKTEFDVALKDMDDASKDGRFGSRETLLNTYNNDRPTYNDLMRGFKEAQQVETAQKQISATLSADRMVSDKQAASRRPAFIAMFDASLASSVITQGVAGKETTFKNVLKLMDEGKDPINDPLAFETTIKMHQSQMLTNIENSKSVAYQQITTWLEKNDVSKEMRAELYGDIDRQYERAKVMYADDKGVGLQAMATIMRTYRDRTLKEKQDLVGFAIQIHTAFGGSPLAKQFFQGGAARARVELEQKDFYNIMLKYEKVLLENFGDAKETFDASRGLGYVQDALEKARTDPAAQPLAGDTVSPEAQRAAHQVQWANSVASLMAKAELDVIERNALSSILSTSVQTGANTLNFAKYYKTIGEKLLKLPQVDGAVITENVSNSAKKAVTDIQKVKTDLETKYKTKLILGYNDAGEITVLAPTRPSIPSQRRAMTMAEMQAAAAPVINAGYSQAAEEFNKQLRPMLNNLVYGRSMLTTENAKSVAKDFAVIINNNTPYAGFFSREGKPVEETPAVTTTPTAAPVATTPAAPAAPAAAPAASAAKPAATSSGKNWWEQQ